MQSNFKNLSANGSATIGAVGAQTILKGITINKLGATANVLTITDIASNTVVATIDTTLAGIGFRDFFCLRGRDGFTCALATGTAADVTIFFE